MSALGAAAAIAATLAGIARLAATDPKRRRAFGLRPHAGRRHVVPAMTAVFLPAALLLALGTGADFFAWLGAVCVAGWAVAAVPPPRTMAAARAAGAAVTAVRRFADGTAAAVSRLLCGRAARAPAACDGRSEDAMARRIAELERRVAQLEAAAARPAAALPAVAPRPPARLRTGRPA